MLSKNSASAGIFEQRKPDYEEALKKCGYKAKLQYMQPNLQQNNTRRRTGKNIWFNRNTVVTATLIMYHKL